MEANLIQTARLSDQLITKNWWLLDYSWPFKKHTFLSEDSFIPSLIQQLFVTYLPTLNQIVTLGIAHLSLILL